MIGKLKMLVASYINTCAYPTDRHKIVLQSLRTLLEEDIEVSSKLRITADEFQIQLSSLNERTVVRKDNGVYYTDSDIVEYIVGNAFNSFVNKETSNVYTFEECIRKIKTNNNEALNSLSRATVFDPTCGTGQFLLQSIKTKCDMMDRQTLNDATLCRLTSTIYGNDIDEFSIKISMIRLFFFLEPMIENVETLAQIVQSLKRNFTHRDYVCSPVENNLYDIIVGNPPYVEYGKLELIPEMRFGNTYANVLYNSSMQLRTQGVMAYIIPLSFVATPRMKKIREELVGESQKMFVINFADRPDCLFRSVHQKLTVLIATKGDMPCIIYSSTYYYWYKAEREKLFERCTTFPTSLYFEGFIPKIGNALEKSIFDKVLRNGEKKLTSLQQRTHDFNSIYLNMRATFWMKAFMHNPGSKEYKEFCFPRNLSPYVISLLNSSLFFFYWSTVSDCWHITGKELDNIKIITNTDISVFEILSQRLLNKLEETKVYVGTVQCDYEYKHRYCKTEIDAIDDALAPIYKLTKEELAYVKSYQQKYRMSDE